MPLVHPPFHTINDSINHKYSYLRCNLPEENPKITQSVTHDRPMETELCFSMHHSWSSLCKHFVQEHHLKLNEGVDKCSGCHSLFASNFIAITHWLQKVLNYRHTFLSNAEKPNYCETCIHWFDQMQLAYKHFSSEVTFDDPLSQKVLNRHKTLSGAFAEPDDEVNDDEIDDSKDDIVSLEQFLDAESDES